MIHDPIAHGFELDATGPARTAARPRRLERLTEDAENQP
jgi:hypothetical protein